MSSIWKTVRIFISSTFRDMHAERDHLIKVVFPRLRQWCEARRLRLVDIDLRWGVTQDEADNGKAIEICFKEIDGSRPFFVCILGNRYGWIPDELPPEELYRFQRIQQETQRSITHLEILHAVLAPVPRLDGVPQAACPHAFFYFRDPACIPAPEALADATQRTRHRDTYFESLPHRSEVLAELKAEIERAFGDQDRVCHYSGKWDPQAANPEDLKLTGRLTNLESFGQQVDADLRWGIAQQFREHIAALRQGIDSLADEEDYHAAFIESKTQAHVPRFEIERQLTDYVAGNDARPLLLTGPPGSGKSAILAHWISGRRQLQYPGEFLLARFVGASPTSVTLTKLLENLCAEFARRFRLEEAVEEPNSFATTPSRTQPMSVPTDPAEVYRQWPRFLDAVACKGPIVLVIDALNQLDGSADPGRPDWLPQRLPPNIRLIASVLDHGARSQRVHQSAAGESADWLSVLRRMDVAEIAVPPLENQERRRIIHDVPSVFCKSLGESDIRLLLENEATRNPLFLTVALEELRVFGSHDRLAERIRAFPQLLPTGSAGGESGIEQALDSVFRQVLDRLDSEATQRHVPALVPAIFRNLASAKEGLSEGELTALLAKQLTVLPEEQRQGELQIVLRQIRPYLMWKAHPQGTLIDFYHRSFWKAVCSRYLPSRAARRQGHRDLADGYFEDQPFYVESPHPGDPSKTICKPNTRKLVELPWLWLMFNHIAAEDQADAEMADGLTALQRLFNNLDFPWSKVDAGLVGALIQDYDEARRFFRQDRLLDPWYYFVRQNTPFLAAHPECFFQQAWNEPVDSLVSQAAQQRWSRSKGRHPPPVSSPQLPTTLLEWSNRPTHWEPPACLMTLLGHAEGVTSVALSGDGFTIVSASEDGIMKVWDARTGTCRATIQTNSRFTTRVALSGDASTVVSASWNNEVKVWDTRTGICRETLIGHRDNVTSVALSGDGCTVVSGSKDKTVKVWDAQTGTCRATLQGNTDWVTSVAFSRDGFTVVSGSRDEIVKVWDARTGAWPTTLEGHKNRVDGVAVSGDGGTVLSACRDKTVKVWDRHAGICRVTLQGHTDEVISVALSGDETTVASGSDDKTVKVWDQKTGSCRTTLQGHTEGVTSVALSEDGLTVVSGSSDKTVKVWDAATAPRPATLQGHTNLITSVALSADGSTVVSGSMDLTAKVWDVRTGACRATLQGHSHFVNSVAISSDGSTVFSGSEDRTVKVWDAQTGACRATLEKHTSGVRSVVLSKDEATIVSGAYGTYDKTVKVWDVLTGDCLSTLYGHPNEVKSLVVSEDGSTFASGNWRETVTVWDARTGTCRATLQEDTDRVTGLALSGDGSVIVSGSEDRTVKVWDAQTGACRATLQGHTGGVKSVALSRDGSTIVSGSDDRTVRVWDARTGACRATYPRTSLAARAAWQSVGAHHEAARCDVVEGFLNIHVLDGAAPLVSFGPFSQAYGPLINDKILAFNSKGEAFWFQIRRGEEP